MQAQGQAQTNGLLARRDFLRLGSKAALAALAIGSGLRRLRADGVRACGTAGAAAKSAPVGSGWMAAHGSGSVVDVVSSSKAIEGLQVDPGRIRDMIEAGVMASSGFGTSRLAWDHFVHPGQRLLLKFSSPLGALLGTEHPMLAALLNCLKGAGHALKDIRVADCTAAQYFDGLADCPVGWSQQAIEVGGESEQLRKYLDGIDAIINLPCLADHRLLGVSCAVENISLPLVRRPGRFIGGDIHKSVVEIAQGCRQRWPVALTITNALRCVFDGGPEVMETTVISQGEVWVSTDPVAVDALACEWLDRQRRAASLPSFEQEERYPRYLSLAQERGMGNADLRHIVRRIHRV